MWMRRRVRFGGELHGPRQTPYNIRGSAARPTADSTTIFNDLVRGMDRSAVMRREKCDGGFEPAACRLNGHEAAVTG